MTAAAFLDRDGVLNALVPDPVSGVPESPLDPADVALLPRAAAGARRLHEAGFLLVGVTNQPAAAKGLATTAVLEHVQARVLALLGAEGVSLDGFEICLHHPDGVVAGLSGPCGCRKPEPGMLLAAAERHGIDLRASWMIGDTDVDVAAGSAAGCHTLLIEHPASRHKRRNSTRAELRASDLLTGAAMLISRACPSGLG